LSPTRTYAPVIKRILEECDRKDIHGMIHCGGGAQTKILQFVDQLHGIKDNMFPVPPLFQLIQKESQPDWKEMYRVFNMGQRMELYLSKETAQQVIAIANSFGVEAQIIGRVEEAVAVHKSLTIKGEHGKFEYQ